MKTIPLTNSDLVTIVDDLFYEELLALGPWRLHDGYATMAMDTCWGYCFMHTVVMQLAGHDLTGVTVDHDGRKRLDNTLRNLRLATRRQQNMNRSRQRTNTSGFIGVHWHKQNRKWHAQIRVNGRRKHLGYFTDKIEAARARDAAILAGPDAEFATLNFPSEAA